MCIRTKTGATVSTIFSSAAVVKIPQHKWKSGNAVFTLDKEISVNGPFGRKAGFHIKLETVAVSQ